MTVTDMAMPDHAMSWTRAIWWAWIRLDVGQADVIISMTAAFLYWVWSLTQIIGDAVQCRFAVVQVNGDERLDQHRNIGMICHTLNDTPTHHGIIVNPVSVIAAELTALTVCVSTWNTMSLSMLYLSNRAATLVSCWHTGAAGLQTFRRRVRSQRKN